LVGINCHKMENINRYIEKHKGRFLEELFGLIRIQSVSSLSDNRPEMYKAAACWVKILSEAGVDRAEIFETVGNPVVFAEKIINPNKPTILIYAHMDVMPVDPLEQWKTNPFEPVVSDGRIWARGANDDKGQSFMHAKAFEFLVRTNTLNCNVKFLIEGEEEIGSPNLGEFCRSHRELLKSNIILVSDTSMISRTIPSITVGLRGLAYWQVEVTGPNRDLHSGIFGGAVANPLNELCKMIAQMTDENHRITIPGFYDDVKEVSSNERALLGKAPFDEAVYRASLGIEALSGEAGYSTTERTGIRPTFDVCGIWGGYMGEGAKTIIPSKAFAKISSRLVPNQDHQKISDLFKSHFESVASKGIKVAVTSLHGGQGYVCPVELPAYRAAEAAYQDVFGCLPVPVRSGGSIPIISSFEEILGVKSVLMGFGLESDAIHSPNENFYLENFYNGIRTIIRFYQHFSI
jgi:acetylornithine deacetylase/succinyl-diaminopimelate desuccinylase-like protein